MELRATQPGNLGSPPDGAKMRFTYPSGSRPLDGYTIKRGIGRGGFGEVYYATSDGGKEVALKLVRRNLEVELRGVSHCLNLKHPNLLAIHDVKQDGQDDSWIVMEYVSGESLEDAIQRNPQGLPIEEVLTWFHGIAAGVGYLHDHGIVHRDLKPGNIFSDEGLVKIGDYGLSKFISCSRRSGQTESVGTVHYMAPEVANGRYGKEIDIYALGVILYEMLTGTVPFEGESVGEVLMKHLTAEPNLSRLAEPYRAVVARALTKDPGSRFRSVQEMAALLPGGSTRGSAFPGFGAAPRAAAVAVNGDPKPRPKDAPSSGQIPEEPIWRGIRDGGKQIKEAWDHSGLHTGLKIALLVILSVLLLRNFGRAWGIIVPIGVVYCIYLGVRAVVLGAKVSDPVGTPVAEPARTPDVPVARPVAAAGTPSISGDRAPPYNPYQPHRARPSRRPGERRLRPILPPKTHRQKATELVGGLLASMIVSTLMFLVAAIFRTHDIPWNTFTWLTLTSIAGSWAVLLTSKLWEGRKGDTLVRRMVLGFTGFGVGLAAFAAANHFFVHLPYVMSTPRVNLPSWMSFIQSLDGSPQWRAFLAYYGGVFFLTRFWVASDPLRRTRLDVFATLGAVFSAWLVSLIIPFPQPWGMLTVTAISVASQLASPWIDMEERRQLLRPAENVA